MKLTQIYYLILLIIFSTSCAGSQETPVKSSDNKSQAGATQSSANDYHLLIGTYTGKSEGIYVYKFNTITGDFASESIAKGLKNPSFLTVSPNENYVYSVSETGSGGSVYSFSLDKTSGKLTQLNTQPAKGNSPCYITVDKTGKWAMVGTYDGGNLSVFPVTANGSLGGAIQTIQHTGRSTNPNRQTGPHVHSVNIAPNNIDVFVADLGIDKIVTYSLNASTGKLSNGNPAFTKVQAGSGPRHFSIHPNGKFAYVIQELTAQVTAFSYKNGGLTALQTISTLPQGYTGELSGADIHISPDGKFLYGSNRGHDSIVMYSIDTNTGKLTYIGNQSTNGKKPRNFIIDPTGNFVLVANQDSDNIVIFKRDKVSGKLSPKGTEIKVPSPVCLQMVSF